MSDAHQYYLIALGIPFIYFFIMYIERSILYKKVQFCMGCPQYCDQKRHTSPLMDLFCSGCLEIDGKCLNSYFDRSNWFDSMYFTEWENAHNLLYEYQRNLSYLYFSRNLKIELWILRMTEQEYFMLTFHSYLCGNHETLEQKYGTAYEKFYLMTDFYYQKNDRLRKKKRK